LGAASKELAGPGE